MDYTFDCTAYWPVPLEIEPDGVPLTVELKTPGAGMMTVLVNSDALAAAKTEASARLDLGALEPDAGALGLAYLGDNVWHSYAWAPFGLGSKKNALVPWKDVASNSLPFGAQLICVSPEDYPELRCRLYVADRFGGPQPDNRLDLFFGRPAGKFRRSLRMRVNLPSTTFSAKPTLGAQQVLNQIGFFGKNGRTLKEDGLFGPQTRHALLTWRGLNLGYFPEGLPARFVPEDPEVYFWLRQF